MACLLFGLVAAADVVCDLGQQVLRQGEAFQHVLDLGQHGVLLDPQHLFLVGRVTGDQIDILPLLQGAGHLSA
ncbi:MAG: hypothetical protein PHW63_00055 [Alphaproteobacteria bacterium]|nr:hypothetical protein [Alphaproteobacteria bacterium]